MMSSVYGVLRASTHLPFRSSHAYDGAAGPHFSSTSIRHGFSLQPQVWPPAGHWEECRFTTLALVHVSALEAVAVVNLSVSLSYVI